VYSQSVLRNSSIKKENFSVNLRIKRFKILQFGKGSKIDSISECVVILKCTVQEG